MRAMRTRSSRAAVVVSCALAWPAAAAAADREIATAGESYRPAAVQVLPGDTVTIAASSLHPLRYEDEAPGGHASGSYARAFPAPGEFRFYCTNHGGPGGAGMAGRVLVSATNAPPVAALDAPASVVAGQVALLSATASLDPEGLALRFDWDLDGDGSYERADAGAQQSFAYPYGGSRTVRVRVTDDPGATAVAERTIEVTPPPPVQGVGTWREPAPGNVQDLPAGIAVMPTHVDRVAPRITLSAPARISAAGLRRRGLRLVVGSSEAATADVRLLLGSRSLGRRSAKLRAGRSTALSVRLARGAARALTRAKAPVRIAVGIAVRDGAGNVSTVNRTVRVIR